MPLTVSCTCGKVFRVKDEMAGRVVTCQVCGNMLTAPETEADAAPITTPRRPVYEEPAAPVVPQMKQCPACAEEIPKGARLCPHCGETLATTLSKDEQASLLENLVGRLDAHLKDAGAQMDDAAIKGGFASGKTIAAGIVTGLAVLMAGYGAVINSRDSGAFIGIGIVIGAISGICLLVSLMNDSKASNIVSAATANAACLNFLTAIRTGRANKAYVALAPTARNAGRVNSITFKDPKIPVHTGSYSVTNPRNFAEYWKSIFTGPSGQSRVVQVKIKGARTLATDLVLVDAELDVTSYPQWIFILIIGGGWLIVLILYLVMRRKEKQIKRKLMVRRNGNWYVAESALSGPLDALVV